PVARSVPWEQNGGASSAASAVSGSPAVVFNGTLFPPSLRAFDAATGTPLQSFTFPGSVNSSPAIVGGLLVVGSGHSFNGSGRAGVVLREADRPARRRRRAGPPVVRVPARA